MKIGAGFYADNVDDIAELVKGGGTDDEFGVYWMQPGHRKNAEPDINKIREGLRERGYNIDIQQPDPKISNYMTIKRIKGGV